MYCKQCGSQLDKSVTFCPKCGKSTGEAPANAKSRIAGGVLNIVLPIGVGRLYLGYTKIAILQLVVAIVTCGIGSLWSLIDGVMILTGNVTVDGQGDPLKD